MKKTTVVLLGSTGSIGLNTLEVIRQHPGRFEVQGLAAGKSLGPLIEQIEEFKPLAVYLNDAEAGRELKKRYPKKPAVFTGDEGLREFVQALDSDVWVAGMSGTGSLPAVIRALERGRRVALANKEILVAAGNLVMRALKENPKASLIPVDSEHSAIFQCLQGGCKHEVERIILTGSGGPLRKTPQEDFHHVSKEVVINHPKWKMGKKISVDSATLMNKGLEIIEASWLFDVPIDRVHVLIHPEAVIHSMVEFHDGSLLAQLGVTDMRLPIQYALSYPERFPVSGSLRLDLAAMTDLHFSSPDRQKFPCLELAYGAAKTSGSAPCVLSAADEVAVEAYLSDKIRFVDIPRIIESVLTHHRPIADPDLEAILSTQAWAAQETRRLCRL